MTEGGGGWEEVGFVQTLQSSPETPGLAAVRLELDRPVALQGIRFRNMYTAEVTVLAGGGGDADRDGAVWDGLAVAVSRRRLMPSPHCVDGARDLIYLTAAGALDRQLGI